MRRTDLVLCACLTATVLGSIAVTIGYSTYLRSDSVRVDYARVLSERLGLPSDIGAVVPRSWRSAEFQQVIVWLPERRGRALTCKQAFVRTLPDQAPEYEILIEGGTCELSTRSWLREDYRYVVDSGLRPGFDPDGPRRVSFANMDVVFNREGFQAKLDQAGGYVEFTSETEGSAVVDCRALNGHTTPEPVLLVAAFHPGESGVVFEQIELSVPEIPLDHLNLQALTGREFCSGVFGGRLTYSEREDVRELHVEGRCADLELPDLTSGWLPSPILGRCPELKLEELRMVDQQPVALRFRGRLEEVQVGDLLQQLGLPQIDGRFALDVSRAAFDLGGVQDLYASGSGRDLSLQTITELIGQGEVTGTLQVEIHDLAVVDNRLQRLRATISVDDATGKPNYLEGRLLTEVASKVLKLNLPPLLPERIEYTRFGVRLDVRDEKLRVFGTHGDGQRTILTARLFGVDVPLVKEMDRTFDQTPLLDDARRQVRARDNTRASDEPRR